MLPPPISGALGCQWSPSSSVIAIRENEAVVVHAWDRRPSTASGCARGITQALVKFVRRVGLHGDEVFGNFLFRGGIPGRFRRPALQVRKDPGDSLGEFRAGVRCSTSLRSQRGGVRFSQSELTRNLSRAPSQ